MPRLDHHLTSLYPDQSRAAVQRWIRDGRVTIDGIIVTKTGFALEEGMTVVVDAPEAPAPAEGIVAQEIPLDILYEDADLIVINKPAGMVVHPAAGHADGTLVNAVLHHAPEMAGVGGERRPGIVHRLDRGTSGVIVVAKNDAAHRTLQTQFKARTVFKEYIALVEGGINPPDGIINAPIGRHPADHMRQTILPPDAETGESEGRDAVTEYHTTAMYHALAQHGAGRMTFTLLRVVLHTGRTHQIRVHLAWRKHPVVGDVTYGPKKSRLPLDRPFLHAHRLRFTLPSTGEEREFVAPLPAELHALLDALEQATVRVN